MTSSKRIALLAAVAVTAAAPAAHADIISILTSATQQTDGSYAYRYAAELTSNSQIDPVGSKDASNQTVQSQFGTVYDFGPILMNADGTYRIDVTGLIANFYWTFNTTDTPAPQTAPTDSASLQNIRFIYNDTTNGIAVAGGSNTFGTTTPYTTVAVSTDADPGNLGYFTVYSSYAPSGYSNLAYDGVSYKGTANTLQQNIGLTSGPLVNVPEPASLAVLGMGLLGLGMIRRRNAI